MSADADRCAIVSRELGEDMAGTASRVTRWLAVEQPGSWGQNALLESKLDERTARTLQSVGRRHDVRVLLMRRPGWRKPEGERRVYVARSHPSHSWIEQLEVDDRTLAHLDWDVFDATEAPGLGEPGPPSVHLVCTNGKHDPCCADQGRPVVRALDEAGVPEVWESSHVGGDRFAANIVCLPNGVYLGRVEPDDAVQVLDELAQGRIRLDHYRGRSCFGTLLQASEIFVRRALAEPRLAALELVGSERLGDDRRRVTFTHASSGVEPRRVSVVVERRRTGEQLLSCGNRPAPPWRYLQVGDVRPATGTG